MSKKILNLIILIALSSSFNIAYSTQTSPHEDNVYRLLEISKIKEQLESNNADMFKQMLQTPALFGKQLSQEKIAEIDLTYRKFLKDKNINEKMYKKIALIYKEELENDEILAIIEFYQSKAGQSLLKKQPILFQKGYEAGISVMDEHAEDLNDLFSGII